MMATAAAPWTAGARSTRIPNPCPVLPPQVVSTEMRAFNNLGWHRGAGVPQYISLTGFGPNINIIR